MQSPSFLVDNGLRLLLFGGKGGVGKTTLASATALHWARQAAGRKILIVSTDPAHSLGDSFAQPIGDQVTPIANVPGLFALEMNAAKRLEAFDQRYGAVLKTIADRGTYFDQEDIAAFFDLSLPGIDELMAVFEITDVIQEGEYDLVILDTAPTGHTLRLLSMPELMERWLHILDLMLAKHRYMVSVFGRYRPDETDAFLDCMQARLSCLKTILTDAVATRFVLVTIPEEMSLEETARLKDNLDALRVPAHTLILNRVSIPGDCPFCEARYSGQKPYLENVRLRFPSLEIVAIPLMPHQVYGQEALSGMIRAMSGEACVAAPVPANILPSCSAGEAPAHRAVDLQSLSPLRLLLFGGKGGVGKTTLATATALHLAACEEGPAQKTLLFSTDPAHSLSDSLAQPIGNHITAVNGVPGLYALEMDSAGLSRELTQTYQTEIDEVFDSFLSGSYNIEFDRQVMEELIALTPPGLDELMALLKIMDFIEEGQFDRYVLDMAPTGHTLRFLETPAMVRQWFITFFKLLVKYQGIVQLSGVSELLLHKSKQLRKVQKMLNDPDQCQFVTVVIPEAMAVSETKRLMSRLADLSVACRLGIANMVMPEGACPFCSSVRADQGRFLAELETLVPGLMRVPLFPHEMRGIAGLSEVANLLYGEPLWVIEH